MVSGASRSVELGDCGPGNGCTSSKAEIEVQAPSAAGLQLIEGLIE